MSLVCTFRRVAAGLACRSFSRVVNLPLPPSDPNAIQRVAFLGTPALAVPTLKAIHTAGYEIPIVVSAEDKRRGRGAKKSPTAVKAAALDLGIRVTSEVDDLLAVHAEEPIDLAVVVAFGQIIRPHVLAEIPMVNIHYSDLPRWRGAAPVERAILAGDTETAIAIMSVVEGLDEGDVWALHKVPIHLDETLLTLWQSMAFSGAGVLIETMRNGFTDPTPQTGEVLYAKKLTVLDRFLDWHRPATELNRIVRVGNAWTMFRGDRFKVHLAELAEVNHPVGEIHDLVVGTGDGGLRLLAVQPAGKPRMDAGDWANGAQPDGERFDTLGDEDDPSKPAS